MSTPAVFLDRDGTLNEEMGYINHLSRFLVFPQAAPALRRLYRKAKQDYLKVSRS